MVGRLTQPRLGLRTIKHTPVCLRSVIQMKAVRSQAVRMRRWWACWRATRRRTGRQRCCSRAPASCRCCCRPCSLRAEAPASIPPRPPLAPLLRAAREPPHVRGRLWADLQANLPTARAGRRRGTRPTCAGVRRCWGSSHGRMCHGQAPARCSRHWRRWRMSWEAMQGWGRAARRVWAPRWARCLG